MAFSNTCRVAGKAWVRGYLQRALGFTEATGVLVSARLGGGRATVQLG